MLTVNGEDLRPQKQFFDNFQNQPSTKVGLLSTPVEDLYVVMASWDGEEGNAKVSVAVFLNPLVSWIWTGGLLLLLGTMISLWPAPQAVARTAPARAPRGALA
jgi:cytochrome c-type biogenesis protein CcmF